MKDDSLTEENLRAVIANQGTTVDLVINGVVVGRIEWDAAAASHAIFGAVQYEDAVRDAIISQLRGTPPPSPEPKRGEVTAEAALGLAINLGMQLRVLGQLASNLASNAPVMARQLFKDCPGCGKRFMPMASTRRRRKDARYHDEKCQKMNQRRKRTAADHAKQQQERRDNALAKAVRLENATMLKDYLRDASKTYKHTQRLQREDPDGAFRKWADLLWRRGGSILPS